MTRNPAKPRRSTRANVARAFQDALSAMPRASAFDSDVADYTFDESDVADYLPAGWRHADA
jgi:hypothetical protein